MARAASVLPEWSLRAATSSPARLSSPAEYAIRRYGLSRGCRRYHAALASAPVKPAADAFVYGQLGARKRLPGMNKGPLAIKGGDMNALQPMEELERRVQALEEAIESEESAFKPSFYTEEDLLALYEDVMAVPIPETMQENKAASLEAVRQAQDQEDLKVIDSLQLRLLDEAPAESSQRANANETVYRRILVRAHEIFARIEATTKAVNPATKNSLPLSVLSIREFEALMRQSLKAQDSLASAVVLQIMKKAHLPLSADHLTTFLEMYASSGDVKAADDLLATFLSEAPTELQKHLHVKAHLKAAPTDEMPVSALELVHLYEEQNVPVAMKTYTLVITSLLSRHLSVARAQAWDLFAHMRYVAHPTPDVTLYTHMIRACASPVSIRYSSEPEKALDLWTEMTLDQKLEPTVDSYNAVILACARSGEKVYVNEAFRLSRQMLDSHRDARGISAFRPDRKTFCALLEGAKRTGNLARARWILAEMVRTNRKEDPNAVDAEIDEEVMMHIFNAYASYKPPPIVRAVDGTANATPSRQASNTSTVASTDVALSATSDSPSSSTSVTVESEENSPSFAHIPPQTHAEVIREVKLLMERILAEQAGANPTATASLPFSGQKFRGVELTSRLLGAYVSVYYKHASLDASRELFWTLFDDLRISRTPRIYVEALERCGMARRGPERELAVPFADQLWGKWTALEDAAIRDGKPLPARMVERAHIAMIRTLALTDTVDRAMAQLRAFAAKYPPKQVRTPPPKPAFRATRTALVGARPLVRMAGVTEVPDDHVPPLFTFRNVEILHHRLVYFARKADIGYVTWLCKAYEWALRVRRDEAVKARPPKATEAEPAPVVRRIEAVARREAQAERKARPAADEISELDESLYAGLDGSAYELGLEGEALDAGR